MTLSSVQENEFIYSSIYNAQDSEALRHYLEYFGLNVNAYFYVCIDFHAGMGKRAIISDRLHTIIDEIVPCISGFLKDKFFGRENLILFVPVAKLGDDEDIRAKQELIQNIYDTVNENLKIELKVGVGKTSVDLSETEEAYKSALNSLKNTSSEKKIVFPEMHMSASELLVERAKLFINSHLSENLSLESVADSVQISVYYLSRLFSQYSGLSFTDYISSQRIARAKGLLKYSRLSISQISAQCGFTDQNYFTKVFKKVTGFTPSQFRKKQSD